jgi:hypothetical protein
MKMRKVKREKLKAAPKRKVSKKVKTMLEDISKKLNEIDDKDHGISRYLESKGVDKEIIFEVDLRLGEHGYRTRKAFMDVLNSDLDALHDAIQKAISKVEKIPSVVVLSTEGLVKATTDHVIKQLAARSNILGDAGQGLFDF